MPPRSGIELEQYGAQMLRDIELTCAYPLNHVELCEINPGGSHSPGEDLELDYLVPVGDTCIIVEITARNSSNVRSKYSIFRRHFDATVRGFEALHSWGERRQKWMQLGVDEAQIIEFRDVTSFEGLFIATQVERLQVDLAYTENIAIVYGYEWGRLKTYRECIGKYTKYHLLSTCFDIVPYDEPEAIVVEADQMINCQHRYVTEDMSHACHVKTFAIDPYRILPLADVTRRDLLPDPNYCDEPHGYQRMLIPGKLQNIRDKLLCNPDFMFPGSILAVLSPDCHYDHEHNKLYIQKKHGALRVVDGQHRLFAYAEEQTESVMEANSQILVTALHFEEGDEEVVSRLSARTFIEINTNQTKIERLHLEGIAYQVLNDTDRRALAAHVLRKVNERDNQLRGLLKTVDSPEGRIRIMGAVPQLGYVMDPNRVQKCAEGVARYEADRQGYEQLFGRRCEELADLDLFVEKGIYCLERYVNLLAGVFEHDWPKPVGEKKGTVFELSKTFGALMRLLWYFVREGADWATVENQISSILDHVLELRGRTQYDEMVMDTTVAEIPDADPRKLEHFEFFSQNRFDPTPITDITEED